MDEEHTPESIISFNSLSYLINYFFIYFIVIESIQGICLF